jgi:hypothetical protein
MKRRTVLTALSTLLLAQVSRANAATQIHVYKNPDCGCCGAWIDHLKGAGFSVQITETADGAAVRQRLGMPERVASCHTATVEGYVLEGHVPADEVKRLLVKKPQAIGLAVPGMPVGSPGMEYGSHRDRYDVVLVGRQGRDSVFATYLGTSAIAVSK